MIQGNKKEILSPDNILKKISAYDIFRMYMGGENWKVNSLCFSPFRKERTPSFLIKTTGSSLSFVDYGDQSKKGNCFIFVKTLFNCNFNTALEIIDRDFGLGFKSNDNKDSYKRIVKEYKQPEDVTKKYTRIQVVTKNFTLEELAYWNQYHQDISDLKKENVFSIDKVYLNGKLFTIKKTELKFGYFYDGHWKIYRPYGNHDTKWVPNNVPITTMDGKENIINCEFAFINKSKKDYMVSKKLIETTCGVQNEGIACFSPENVKFLKENSKRQILSFDSDQTGVKNSLQITKLLDFEYCNCPRSYLSDGIKDWADLAKDYGMHTLEKVFKRKKLIK